MERLRTETLDTGVLPSAERLAFWQEVVGSATAPVNVRTDDPAGFVARASFLDLGVVQLGRYHYPTVEVRRTEKLIRRSDPEICQLALTRSGRGTITQGERNNLIDPNEFTFFDCSYPWHAVHQVPTGGGRTGTSVSVQIARSLLSIPPARLARLAAVRISGRHGVGALLSRHLDQLTRHPEQYRTADAGRLGAITLDLITVLLAEQLDVSETVPEHSRQEVLLARVRSFIHQHLGDPRLTPAAIAAAHHISVRSLYRLFERQETTVAELIRTARLDRCRRDLIDPALRDQPVHVLAARWGFTDRPRFSRLFRSRYGASPGAYRRAYLR